MSRLKDYKKTLIITLIVLAIPALIGVLLYDKLPEQVPVHFNFKGEPDRYGCRLSLILMNFILLPMQLLVIYMTLRDPKTKNVSDKVINLTFWALPFISLFITYPIFGKALGYNVDITMAVSLLTAIMFIIVGNYLPKCRQNSTIGIKLKWTLEDQDNWDKTHRLGGYVFMIAGMMMLVFALLRMPLGTFICALSCLIIPLIYSYLLSKKS